MIGLVGLSLVYLVSNAELTTGTPIGGHGIILNPTPTTYEQFFFDVPGLFDISGTVGHLTGAVNNHNGFSINLDVIFQGLTSLPPSGSPKNEQQVPVDFSDWRYFAGGITGTFAFSNGTVLHIAQVGPAFQIGTGANGKNMEFGSSGWFQFTDFCPPYLTGDFNVDLHPTPEPGTMALWMSGLVFLAIGKRYGEKN